MTLLWFYFRSATGANNLFVITGEPSRYHQDDERTFCIARNPVIFFPNFPLRQERSVSTSNTSCFKWRKIRILSSFKAGSVSSKRSKKLQAHYRSVLVVGTSVCEYTGVNLRYGMDFWRYRVTGRSHDHERSNDVVNYQRRSNLFIISSGAHSFWTCSIWYSRTLREPPDWYAEQMRINPFGGVGLGILPNIPR